MEPFKLLAHYLKKKKTVLLDIFEHCTIFYTVFYDELI